MKNMKININSKQKRVPTIVFLHLNSKSSVISHPFFHVTQKDGKYQIKDLPAGKYTVEIWHERLGEQTKEIEIVDGQSAKLYFTLSKS